MNNHDQRERETAAETPVDLNSRIETRLWVLHKGSNRAEARRCIKFRRRDFRVYVNGQLLWSRNFAFEAAQAFDEHATAKHGEFLADGWVTTDEAPAGE